MFLTHGEGYYEEYKYGQKFSSYGLADFYTGGNVIKTTDLVRQLWLKNDLYGGVLSLQYNKDLIDYSIGGSWNRFEGDHFGTITWAQQGIDKDHEWYNYPAIKEDANIYGKLGYKLSPRLYALVDLQYRRAKHMMTGTRRFPSLSVSREFNFFNLNNNSKIKNVFSFII